MSRDTEPISLPRTGGHLTYSPGSAIWYNCAPISPACVNLMSTLKWPLCFEEVVSVWQVELLDTNLTMLIKFYFL